MSLLDIKHISTTAFHSQKNGNIERGHQAFSKDFTILSNETGKVWTVHLPHAIWADRIAIIPRQGILVGVWETVVFCIADSYPCPYST